MPRNDSGNNHGCHGFRNWETRVCAGFDFTDVIAGELDAWFDRSGPMTQGEFLFAELPEFRKECAMEIRRHVETMILSAKGVPGCEDAPILELDGIVPDIDFGEVFDAGFKAIDDIAIIRGVDTTTIPCSGRDVRREWTFVVPKDEIAFAAECQAGIPGQPDGEFGEIFRYAFDSAKDGRMVLENGNVTLDIEFHGGFPPFESLPKPWERCSRP